MQCKNAKQEKILRRCTYTQFLLLLLLFLCVAAPKLGFRSHRRPCQPTHVWVRDHQAPAGRRTMSSRLYTHTLLVSAPMSHNRQDKRHRSSSPRLCLVYGDVRSSADSLTIPLPTPLPLLLLLLLPPPDTIIHCRRSKTGTLHRSQLQMCQVLLATLHTDRPPLSGLFCGL